MPAAGIAEHPLSLMMHFIDIALIALIGDPVPCDLLDAAVAIISEIDCLSGFELSIAKDIARGDPVGVLANLRTLPDMASDKKCLRDTVKSFLTIKGIPNEQQENLLAGLKDLSQLFKLFSIITKELETIISPQFDSVLLIVR